MRSFAALFASPSRDWSLLKALMLGTPRAPIPLRPVHTSSVLFIYAPISNPQVSKDLPACYTKNN